MNQPQNKANFGITLFLFLVALVLIVFSIKQQSDTERREKELSQEITKQVTQEIVNTLSQEFSKSSEFPDYGAIKSENPNPEIKAVRIASGCPQEGCINDKPATIDFDGIHKKYEVRGKFSRAYLYIEALVDYQRPLTAWDDFYFKINGLGGHLIVDGNALPVPPSETSRFLYDLQAISYFSSIKDKEKKVNKQENINMFVLLRDGVTLDAVASLSSNRPGRVIKEVAIYYECFTGSECSIQEKK